MAKLTEDDIEKLFSGAPQYFARSEGHFTGAPHPSVAYPWDESLEIRDLTDHVQIEDEAWGAVTAWPHITRRRNSRGSFSRGSFGRRNSDSLGHSPNNGSGNGSGNDNGDSTPVSGISVLPAPPSTDRQPQSTTSSSEHKIKRRGHYYPRCRERPSMLSMQGLEKGTVGYEAALELAVSDALQEEQYGFDHLGARPSAITEARQRLLEPVTSAAADDESASSVKHVGETKILEELIKNGQRYAKGSFHNKRHGEQFYNELFQHILRPPKKSGFPHRRSSGGNSGISSATAVQGTSSYGHLASQIEALLDVLATPNVWIDFSHVEWRMRLGQVLWASSPEDDFDDGCTGDAAGTAPLPPPTSNERYTERYWLLLQILLATELLLRLDAITEGDEIGLEYVRPAEVQRFEKEANQSVRWSLILARAWLENIEVVRVSTSEPAGEPAGEPASKPATEPAGEPAVDAPKPKEDVEVPLPTLQADGPAAAAAAAATPAAKSKLRESMHFKHTIGWITTITRKLISSGPHPHSAAATVETKTKHVYAMRARYAERQQCGLEHFAFELKWPNEIPDLVSQNAQFIQEHLNTKLPDAAAPPCSTVSTILPALPKTQLEFSRHLPRRRKVVAGLHPGGWLSKSYLSSLILPGDSLCSSLMATMLESDTAAIKALGPVAYLGSGFVYGGKSFWSTACVVGRVLAAGAGAAECMGWVSSDVLPEGLPGDSGASSGGVDCWVPYIDVDDVADDVRMTGRRSRIWGKAAIERESCVLGDADHASVLPADFVFPFEAVYKVPPPLHTRIQLRRFGLCKSAGDPAARATAAQKTVQPLAAEATFVVASDGEAEQVVTYKLAHDIYFVTGHPCVPSQRVKVLKSLSSPTIQQIDVTGTGGLAGRASSVHATGHPLHKYYSYASIHLSELIHKRSKTLAELLAEYAATTNRTAGEAKVLVVDCITGFAPQPAAHEMPLSPVMHKKMSMSMSTDNASISSLPLLTKEISPITPLATVAAAAATEPATSRPTRPVVTTGTITKTTATAPATTTATYTASPVMASAPAATSQMHQETRRRRFGSDMEMLVRALCAEKGWNAIISRRRRGCLACAIREAGALGWKVVVRVD